MVFGQSQCTVPVGQSEQTALVGRRDFVENEAFERGGHRGPTIMYSICKIMCFLNIKDVNIFCYTKYTKIMIFKKASYDPFKYFLYIFKYTVVTESIQTPLNFSLFVILQAIYLNIYSYI